MKKNPHRRNQTLRRAVAALMERLDAEVKALCRPNR